MFFKSASGTFNAHPTNWSSWCLSWGKKVPSFNKTLKVAQRFFSFFFRLWWRAPKALCYSMQIQYFKLIWWLQTLITTVCLLILFTPEGPRTRTRRNVWKGNQMNIRWWPFSLLASSRTVALDEGPLVHSRGMYWSMPQISKSSLSLQIYFSHKVRWHQSLRFTLAPTKQ